MTVKLKTNSIQERIDTVDFLVGLGYTVHSSQWGRPSLSGEEFQKKWGFEGWPNVNVESRGNISGSASNSGLLYETPLCVFDWANVRQKS